MSTSGWEVFIGRDVNIVFINEFLIFDLTFAGFVGIFDMTVSKLSRTPAAYICIYNKIIKKINFFTL